MTDAVARFWDKYLSKTASYKVPEPSRQWYVRCVEAFIDAHAGRKLTTLGAQDVRDYLEVKCVKQFPELFERFVAEIRVLQYSIRTEQAYVEWIARFIVFSKFKTQSDIRCCAVWI